MSVGHDPVVDLRSDTVTRPTPGMREAIARAEVGDDTLGDDPTVLELQARVAGILGKEAALFLPSGIMANQTAILLHTTPGTEVVCEAHAHIFEYEEGAPQAWAGVQLRLVPTVDGLLTADLVRAAIRPISPVVIRTSLIEIENTHNSAGGRIMPVEAMAAIREVAAAHRLPVHLDGARLWNAAAASGVPEAEYAAHADTVMVSLSKGLGCPVGSMLAGSRENIERAWRIRRRLGGSMRQAGILAAAGLYALEHHRARLADDHANARLLARLAAGISGVTVVNPETNIVMIDLDATGLAAGAVAEGLARRGVKVSIFSPTRIRAVTHMDVDETAIRRAAEALSEVVRSGE